MSSPRPVEVPEHAAPAARALVMLHAAHLREFVGVWREARADDLALPRTADPSYGSLAHLLNHVLRAARGYMVWCCEVLDLPDPGIEKTPPPEQIEARLDEYLEHLLARWATPLKEVDAERIERTEAPSRWGQVYCVDAMLEHAVMHPIRHTFQLRALLTGRRG